MIKNKTLVILFGLTLLVFGCTAEKVVDVNVAGNKTIHLRVGQTVNVKLGSNPTTGYIWMLAEKEGYNALTRLGNYKYVPDATQRIGAGGTQVFTFEGAKRGQAELVFEYRRPWEGDKAPVKKYEVNLVVH